jgi:hypothetical protein
MEKRGTGYYDRQAKFDQSGKNTIPVGMMGKETSFTDKRLYDVGPSKKDTHPVGFY